MPALRAGSRDKTASGLAATPVQLPFGRRIGRGKVTLLSAILFDAEREGLMPRRCILSRKAVESGLQNE